MKARFGLAALDAIKKNYDIFLDRLIKGYEKVTGKKPEGIELTMIKREAYEKAEDSAKVVDMEGKTLDPSKPIMGGKQETRNLEELLEGEKRLAKKESKELMDDFGVQMEDPTKPNYVDPESEEGMDVYNKYMRKKYDEEKFGEGIKGIYDEAKGPGKGDEMVEALKSPGARKSTEIIEKQIQETFPDIKLFGDETFEEILEIQRTGKHPRMKADGGRIGFANGGENIIGADLKEKESVLFPKGDFENIKFTSPTRKDYNIRATEDLVRNLPGGIVRDIGAPAAALAISRPYDMIQAGARTTTSDIDRAIQSGALTPREIADEAFGLAYERENPLSTAIERTIGAAGPLAERVGDMFSGVGNFFFAPAGAADFQGGEMLQAPTSPVRADYERAPNAAFAELLAESATADDAFEEALAEATRKGQRQSFLSQVADFLPFGPKSLTGGITRGIGSMFRNIAPASYGTSQAAINAMTPSQRQSVASIYGQGGIMQGYNPVSAFGRGPRGAIQNRIDNILARKDAGKSYGAKNLAKLQQALTQVGGGDGGGPNITGRGRGRDTTVQMTGVNQFDENRGQGGPGDSSKIVCTMMNESYGFGNFRNKIWLKHSRDLPKEYEIGYHTIFLPLVKFAKGKGKLNKVVKKTLEHIARHRTLDLKQEMKGKTHALGRVYRKILEPICLMVGKIKKVV